MKSRSFKSAREKSINLKPDVEPFSNKTLCWPMRMITSPKSFLKEDTKSKKSDRILFKSKSAIRSSPPNSGKSTEALISKLNCSRNKDSKAPNFMKHTSKNCNWCSRIKSSKVNRSVLNATTSLTKSKFLKSSSNKKKISSRISWPELPTIWKGSLSIPKKSRSLKSLLKSKHSKRTTLLKSPFLKIKFPSLKLPMPTETMNLSHSFKKTETSKIDTKAKSKILLLKMILSGKEFSNLKKWTKPKSKIFNKNTATFMSKEPPVSKNNIREKSGSCFKKLTAKSGSLMKRIPKFSISSDKKGINSLHSRTESSPW